MNTLCAVNYRILIVAHSPSLGNDLQKIFHPCKNDTPGHWSESNRDVREEIFGHVDTESFELEFVENEVSGCERIRAAKEEGSPFAIIFLDWPVFNGRDWYETVERMWDEDPEVQVVLCNAYPYAGWSEVWRKLRCPDRLVILRKPLEALEVRQISTVLINKWVSFRQARLHVQELELLLQDRTDQLEEIRHRMEQDSLLRQALEIQLARVTQDVDAQSLELSRVREHALKEIQEREQMEILLRRQSQELTRSNRDLEQFASIAAHDLQEPLHSIQVFLDLFRTKYGAALDEQGKGYLDRVKKAAGRMQELIQSLLIYSRVNSQHETAAPLDLRSLVDEILLDLAAKIEESQALIQVGELPIIWDDPFHIRQLLQNLLVNALKFHRPGIPPVVHVSGTLLQDRRHHGSGKPEQLCQIVIQDHGIGIPSDQIDKIFGMFKRLNRKNEYEGTGIGLAVCQRIVNQRGGALSVRSKVGEGSTFTATIPFRR